MDALENQLKEARFLAEEADKKYDEVQIKTNFNTLHIADASCSSSTNNANNSTITNTTNNNNDNANVIDTDNNTHNESQPTPNSLQQT